MRRRNMEFFMMKKRESLDRGSKEGSSSRCQLPIDKSNWPAHKGGLSRDIHYNQDFQRQLFFRETTIVTSQMRQGENSLIRYQN
jgi:hypothetical protein